MAIGQLIQAEIGWKAVFAEPDGSESVSRILGWAVAAAGEAGSELVGIVVDPSDPSRIVTAPEAVSPAGGGFTRYRFVPPEPVVVAAPAPPPAAAAEQGGTAEQLAKGLLRRKR